MLQIVQYQKNGEIQTPQMPVPQCLEGGILVQTTSSLISAGTEKASVTNSQGSLLDRARKQPDQVKLVLDTVKKQGIVDTIRRVQNKLDSFKALGYSASGIVIESKCDEFQPGDRVACAGAGYANHAEFITVPKNLAAKIPTNVSFEDAAFTTVASIALQGVRQANPKLGDNVAVMGLGLIGQITVQLLKANGCRVVGLDVNKDLFDVAKKFGCDSVLESNSKNLQEVLAFSNGIGCDSVIITASTSSSEPLQFAMEMCRQKGDVVIVGAVGMDLQRQPFYKKEVNLRIACSYGPGRYDANYEELGHDYPAAYVRYTENRNMQTILTLLASKKLDFATLRTHVFKAEEADKAYDMITKASEPFIGILLDFGLNKKEIKRAVATRQSANDKINIGFIGLGQFAQNYLLPPIKSHGAALKAVANSTPINSLSAAQTFGFGVSSTDGFDLIQNPDVNMVFCASRHQSHGAYVIAALKAGKSVFVEKPLCTTIEELEEIANLQKANLMVGYNRRFSAQFGAIDKFFGDRTEPLFINYRVNAGFIPKNSWVQHPAEGGRILGEVCHFIDTMIFLTKAKPIKVYADCINAVNSEVTNRDNVAITIKFDDGSCGVVEYLANGDSSLEKEYCEVFSARSTAIMHNFDKVTFKRGGKTTEKSFDGKKGINEEVKATLEAFTQGKAFPIPFDQIYYVNRACFAAIKSLETGLPQLID